jgi:DNA mismatch endonuclease (patch repair protein)
VSYLNRRRRFGSVSTTIVDVLSPAQRRLNMSRIRNRDTKPEMVVRRGLHALGLRYRLHVRMLKCRPDLVLPRFKTAVFVNGCFWHAHGCAYSKFPMTRQAFWRRKLLANAARDQIATETLCNDGWRVVVIWECSMRGKGVGDIAAAIQRAATWIRKGQDGLLVIS